MRESDDLVMEVPWIIGQLPVALFTNHANMTLIHDRLVPKESKCLDKIMASVVGITYIYDSTCDVQPPLNPSQSGLTS